MKRAIQLAAVLIVAWAGAFGIAFAVVEWRNDGNGETAEETPTSLSSERLLTATEAALAAEDYIAERPLIFPSDYGYGCQVTDFNSHRDEWILVCRNETLFGVQFGEEITLAVHDPTSNVRPL